MSDHLQVAATSNLPPSMEDSLYSFIYMHCLYEGRLRLLMKIFSCFCIFLLLPSSPLFFPLFLPSSKCIPYQLVLSPIWTWTTPPLTATIKSTTLFTTLLPEKFISGSINLLHIQISHFLLAQIRDHQTALFHSPSYSASEFRLVYLLTDACWHSDPKWFSSRKSLANCAKKLHRLTGGSKVSSSFFQSTGSAPGTTITGHRKGHVNFAAEDNTSSSAPTIFIKSVKEMPSSLSVVQTSDLPLGAVDFEGWIPKEIGKLKHLVKLDIAICGITGRIPEEIGVLENLNTLFAQVNGTLIQHWENNFIGNILARLESSGKLQLLDLSSNKLTGIYGAMALAGSFICSITGVDSTGGYDPSLKAIVDGLGYAAPPIMALLFILDDEVVKYSPHARAIRDVEDEELRSFFFGMSPWQFILIVIASSVGEELFYRAAVQGSLADTFLRGTEFVKDARGIAALSGMLPLFVPFAQAFAAVITAALTGSLYYIATAPKDPTYVVAPVLRSRSGQADLKKLFAAWYERRQMKKIYSPLLEGILALYLGYEWVRTGNILAPMITHGIYSAVVLGHGLWKIHDHRRRLRNRINQVKVEAKDANKL